MNLEVRSVLVNKGNVVKRIRQQQGGDNAVDFVMCAGDDQTDEDMFRALFHDTKAHTILVGPPTKLTLARFCLDTSQQVVDLLGQLVSSPHHKQSSSL
jgi:trehalose-phosphatase